MNKTRKLENAGMAVAAAFLLAAPVAFAQHPASGATAGAMFVRNPAAVTTFRAPSSPVNHNGSVRPTTGAGHTRGTTALPRPTSADFLLTGTLDPYLNVGTVPQYIDGILNAGPGSAYYGNNSLLGVKAFIDPVTQLEFRAYTQLARAFQSSGVYVPLLPMYADVPVDEGQVADASAADQGQTDQPEQAGQAQDASYGEEAQQTATEEQPPVQDEGEFLLIFRDGRSDQAAAFTRSGNQVVYITPDGMRESVALSEIDVEATQRVNQERGTPLQLPLS